MPRLTLAFPYRAPSRSTSEIPLFSTLDCFLYDVYLDCAYVFQCVSLRVYMYVAVIVIPSLIIPHLNALHRVIYALLYAILDIYLTTHFDYVCTRAQIVQCIHCITVTHLNIRIYDAPLHMTYSLYSLLCHGERPHLVLGMGKVHTECALVR